MKKYLLAGGLFLVFYSVFVIATLPVNVALSWLELPKGLSLTKASGTIWHAEITQVTLQKKNQSNVEINKVTTNLSLASLFVLSPSIVIKFGGKSLDGPRGNLTLSGSLESPEISNANISLAANDIAKELTLPVDVSAFGMASLALDSYVLGKPLCATAKGLITWPKAALNAFEQTVELGTIKAKVGCEKGVVVINVDPKNNLGLSFTTYIRNQRNISGNGYITPGNKFPKKLNELLPFIGKPDNKGRYRIGF